jgi:inner membrane protein
MLFITHLAFALFCYALAIGTLKGKFIFFLFVILGALIVDIDSETSCFGKYKIFRPLQWVAKHRGIFHTVLLGVFFSLIILLFNRDASFGFAFGYLSHLFADCFTKQGVMLLWPISSSRINFFGGIKTGSMWEQLLLAVLVILDIILFYRIIF